MISKIMNKIKTLKICLGLVGLCMIIAAIVCLSRVTPWIVSILFLVGGILWLLSFVIKPSNDLEE